MDWIIANKEWLFGGVAVAVPLAIVGWLRLNHENKQIQRGGKNSTNIQVGGDMRVGGKENDE
ncbi:MAG: hypothetical protein EPN36_06815 [Rhodanobacteraceae bacterium]|nr:MAG: hypothetical protein EPN36_06815 [Rhodanobacteraceae bacterium]